MIVARGRDGAIVELPVQQNLHRDGILAVTQVPAPDVAPRCSSRRSLRRARWRSRCDYVGVLCVEFFVVDDGSTDGALVANEMAPRPHNSGHYSIDACDVSQFELQVRTLVGAPLPRAAAAFGGGDAESARRPVVRRCRRRARPPWEQVLALPGVHLHLYGKLAPRPRTQDGPPDRHRRRSGCGAR